jgi:putative spermidine/putrescine transport system permease protein
MSQPRTGSLHWLLILPLLAVLAVLFIAPLYFVIERGFTDPPGAGWDNYQRALEDPAARRYAWNTIRTAITVTLCASVLGYTYAYATFRASRRMRVFLLYCVLVPFWTSLLVRTYAWAIMLRDEGVINKTLASIGLIDAPLPLLRNSFAVTLGMTQILLPFVILPCYSAMTRVDVSLVQAARSLGATPTSAFFRVFLPLTRPGLAAGAFLTFILATGYYITPVLLGGPGDQPVAVLIESAVQQQGDWGLAGALAALVTVLVLVALMAGWRSLTRSVLESGRRR